MNQRVWIFVIGKELDADQMVSLNGNCKNFIEGWAAHEQKLSASFEIYKKRLLIFKVNEQVFNASGCSIDKLTRFIKEQEATLHVQLLNRLLAAYEENDEIRVVETSRIKELIQNTTLNENTIVYDHSVSSSDQLAEWRKKLKETWLCKYLPSYSSE